MPGTRFIRCGKCHVVMGLRYFVSTHRRANGVDCPPVPCFVCKDPVGHEGLTAFGDAVCSDECASHHPKAQAAFKAAGQAFFKAERDVVDQLAAMKRAQALPPVYQRLRRAS